MSEELILSVTSTLAITQALNPNERDAAGFSNADFPAAFALVAIGDLAGCAALLKLYPRQAGQHGITDDMLQPYLGESVGMAATEARAALAQARKGAAGILAWTERKDGSILFNGINLDPKHKKQLRTWGKHTPHGWVVDRDKLALATYDVDSDLIANAGGLREIIQGTPQVVFKAPERPAPPPMEISVEGLDVNWTNPFSDTGVEIRKVVKLLGARFNGDKKNWTLADPVALQALLLLADDLDVPVHGVEAQEALSGAAMALAEEVRSGVVKVVVLHETEGHVWYRTRSKVEGAWEKAKSAGAFWDREQFGGSIRVDKADLRAVLGALDPIPNLDASPLLPLLQKFEAGQAAAIPQEVLDSIPTHTKSGLEFFAHQRDGIAYLMTLGWQDSRLTGGILADDMGLGKQAPLSEPVLTPFGWSTMGQLKAGDFVVGTDGTPIKVLGVFPQVSREVWAVTFSDGVVVRCGPEHLWTVRDYNMKYRGHGWVTKTAKDLMDSGLTYKNGIPKFEIPDFHGMKVGVNPAIEPWLFGQILGNGSTSGLGETSGPITISCDVRDRDVVSRILALGGVDGGVYGGTHRTRLNASASLNPARKLIARGLNVKSKEKFIPEECLGWTWYARVDLLRGLMDSDGSNSKNRITFHSCSEALAEDVARLVRSLGGAAVVRRYDRFEEGKPVEWQVNVHTQFCPFFSERKSAGWSADSRQRGNRIVSMERVEDEDCVCILVDSPDHLYVTTGYKLTHNTIQAICAADARFPKGRILIVCPASLKSNWEREIEKWLGPEDIQIISGRSDVLTDARWVIINYDILSVYVDVLRAAQFALVIADEAHNLRNEETQRSIAFMGRPAKRANAAKGRDAEEAIPGISETCEQSWLLTGTPMMNRPKELFSLLKIINHPLSKDRWRFLSRYCAGRSSSYGTNFNGAANLGELSAKMAGCYLKRLKTEVLNLPPKIRAPYVVDLSDSELRAYHAAVDAMLGRLADGDQDEDGEPKEACVLAELNALKLQTARAKIPATVELAEEIVDEGRKVVIFSGYLEVLDALQEKFGAACVRIDGSVSPAKRQAIVDTFQGDPKVQVFLGQIEAAGVGLTLTAAQDVIINDLPWTPAILLQAEDRTYRIGQTGTVNVRHMEAHGTFDPRLREVLDMKAEIINAFETGADAASKARLSIVKQVLKAIKKDAKARAAVA